ncbi:hypothetical protein L210DRAFT_3740734 [Boletus edulis BED1]|uniref:Uncharacterized protein n=1 Tax=Boletus edulis BED1 TaxID=1328754 RepID=A0AAD4BGB2_BOLED|nr:hypothetical protein L210DRAFT_3740734 [Boletus edulis BED1]
MVVGAMMISKTFEVHALHWIRIILADTNDSELLSKLDGFRSGLDEGDGDLPAGFIDKLKEPVRDKLRGTKHTSFSKVDPMTLLSLKISSGPPFLISEKRQAIEHRVYVNAQYTVFDTFSDLKTALANPKFIDGLVTSNIFEAKRYNVRVALPLASGRNRRGFILPIAASSLSFCAPQVTLPSGVLSPAKNNGCSSCTKGARIELGQSNLLPSTVWERILKA